MKSFDTPVLFLIFNRPDFSQKVFLRIREARPSQLFVAADGPRDGHPTDAGECYKARELINEIDWPCEVKILFRDRNLGCRAAISEAITWFFEHVDSGIILEDDCVPDLSFFPYCAELLERYKNDERVMSISGDCFFPDEKFSDYSYHFSAYLHVWGWATWRRAWKHFNPDFNAYKGQNTMEGLTSWLGTAAVSYWADIMRCYADGKIDTWDYPWLFSCWRKRGISIVPEVNLVSNIGTDSRGTHVGGKPSSTTGRSVNPMEFPLRHPPEVIRNKALECKTEMLFINPYMPSQLNSQKKFKNKVQDGLMKIAGKILRLFKPEATLEPVPPRTKPNPKDYSTIVGKGSVVPCQIEAYFMALNRYVNDGDNVLDVGFGLGYGLNILAIKASKVSGVDVDPLVYDYCQSTIAGRNPRLDRLCLYDGVSLPFADKAFDILTCVDVLEHVEDYHAFLTELLRVSKKGVFISTPNRRPEYTNPDGTPKNHWHLREWSYEELNSILQKHGKVEWHFLDGPFDGPFVTTDTVSGDTLTLSPFLFASDSPSQRS